MAVASAFAVSACGGVDDSAGEDAPARLPDEPAQWIEPAQAVLPKCDRGDWMRTQGLSPVSTEYDYVAFSPCIREECGHGDSDGTPCAIEDDAAACMATVERALIGGPAVVTTRGGEVVKYIGRNGLLDFLGDVDTPQEALLVAFFNDYGVRCDKRRLSAARPVEDGYQVIGTRVKDSMDTCPEIVHTRYLLRVGTDGEVTELDSEVFAIESGWCIGRRPSGLHALGRGSGESRVGDHFAGIAALEAAAVTAFERLAHELDDLGAPADLVEDALAASRDEARHAVIMGDVARHFGVEPTAPEIDPADARTPFAIAVENAVEGCVRETFGALTGSYQGLRAEDSVVASAMRRVSRDELRHADLSHRVDAFFEERLTESERVELAAAKRKAIRELRKELEVPLPPTLAAIVGHPAPDLSAQWIDRLERDVWATA